ncbi:MAG TPA: peptide ABC transporter substrate-binding protein [Stellaceae bacterium]|nr:peptide ABC transporter substrate-binding protein [Stellaceae bacterium]
MALLMLPAAASAHDQLTIGIVQFPATLNPDIDSMAAKSYVLGFAVQPFTVFDADWKIVCLLCTELPSFDNGRAVKTELPGGKTGVDLTYTIRPDAMWADGTPVTTDDVKFTYEFGRNKASAVANAEMYREILGVDVKDDKTFTLHFDRLGYDYAAINDFVLLPAHLERAAFSDPAQYRVRTRYATDPTNPGLYNGPYRISEFATGSHIALEPNPHWAGPPPHFKRIVIRAIENTAALQANLLSGSIDMVAGEIGLPLDEALAFDKRHGNDFTVIYKPGLTFEHVDCNLDNPALADVRVRRALLLGLDRETLTKTVFAGKQAVADGFVAPQDAGFTDDVPKYRFDPAKAKQLLEEAGWHAQADGARKNADGKTLSFELTTTAGNRSRELVEQVLQSQWKAIGVDVRIHNEPARVLFGETLPHRHFDLAMYAWMSAPENSPRSLFRSNEVPNSDNGYAGENLSDYKNPEMDRLIDALEVELDRAKRNELWAAVQRLYATDLPSLPLYFRSDAYILPKWLTGVRPTGNQYPTTLWVTDWGEAP